VVNIVSIAGEVAGRSGPYSASKHAQLAFSRTVAVELGRRGIRVHTVKPGLVETEGFPQGRLPGPVRRLVIGPEQVARHVLESLDRGRGETTVPRYYRIVALLQALAPNLFVRMLTRRGPRSRIAA
jgi:short-subunit dehydrogenase